MNEKEKIYQNIYKQLEPIGNGSFGTVFKVLIISTLFYLLLLALSRI